MANEFAIKDSLRGKVIAVLSRGWGLLEKERKHSVNYGATVANVLSEAGYDVIKIESCDKAAIVEMKGSDNLIVYNCLFGRYGEDGTIPSVLEFLNVSYTGSGPLSSALATDKARCSLLVKDSGVSIPEFKLLDYKDWVENGKPLFTDSWFSKKDNTAYLSSGVLNTPIVVKPNGSAFSSGFSIVDNNANLTNSIEGAAYFGDKILLQKYIPGTDVHVPVLCGKALSPVEAIPYIVESNLPPYSFHTANKTYMIASRFPRSLNDELRMLAEKAHKVIGCRGLTRCDFRVSDDGGVYFLEINVQHSIRPNSIAVQSGMSCKLTMLDLIEHVLNDRWIPRTQ